MVADRAWVTGPISNIADEHSAPLVCLRRTSDGWLVSIVQGDAETRSRFHSWLCAKLTTMHRQWHERERAWWVSDTGMLALSDSPHPFGLMVSDVYRAICASTRTAGDDSWQQ